jgi:hypothetical protein
VLEAKLAAIVADNAQEFIDLADAIQKALSAATNFFEYINDANRGGEIISQRSGMWTALNTSMDDLAKAGADERRVKAFHDRLDAFMSPKPKASGKGEGGSGGTGSRARRARTGRSLADEFGQIEGTLDPVARANAEYEKTIKLLDRAEAAGLKAAHGFDALREAARGQWSNTANVADNLVRPMEELVPAIKVAVPDVQSLAKELEMPLVAAAENIGPAWDNAAHGIIGAAHTIVDGVRGSGVLDVLSGVLDLFLSLGSIGAFGSKISANINSGYRGARAGGGSVGPGGYYLVGERGPELFAPGGSGTIIPNAALGGGRGTEVHVVPSPYFDAVVTERAQAVAAPIGVRAAQAGASMASTAEARRRRKIIPSRL